MIRLIVAEKPSMARSIAAALGIAGSGQGCILGRDAIVTWCIGHLVELAPPEAYDERLERWSVELLPILPEVFRLVPTARTSAQFRVVRELLRRADVGEVVNACDSGREGELIFDYVYRLAGSSKPVLRLWTASLTDEAIRGAYRQMKPAAAYAGLRDAARSRSEADWLVGLNATRAQTLVAQRAGQRGVWSLGRVQTPTLALIVERGRAIREFAVKDYWTVDATLDAAGGVFEARWFRPLPEPVIDRMDHEDEARRIATVARRGAGRVTSVDAKDVRIPPERLYDLTTLQREANRRWGYSAKRTLDLAQALYEEHKVLSYPRTSSRHLTADVAATLPGLLTALARQPAYAAATATPHGLGAARLGPRFVDDAKVEDHHALLPTGRVPGQLDAAEARIYDLVVRRLLGAFFPDRVEARTTVTCELGGEAFRARGVVVKAKGWSAVDPATVVTVRKAEGDNQTPLPVLRAGDPLQIAAVRASARRTKPPRPFTDAELLGAMETAGRELDDEELRLAMRESGLGTPATRASIIEHLIARDYVARVRRNLVATSRGAALIDGLPIVALKSAALTGEWEAKLARMGRGAYPRAEFMRELAAYTRDVVQLIVAAPPPRPSIPSEASGRPSRAPSARGAPQAAVRSAPPAAPRRRTGDASVAPRRLARTSARSPRPAGRAALTVPPAHPRSAAALSVPTSARPAPPTARPCPGCQKAARAVWSERQAAWFQRCDACARWLPAPTPARP